MAKRVLLAMLSLSQWRDGLDLNSREAFRITKVLFEDEASVLAARPRQSWPQVISLNKINILGTSL